MHLKCADTPVLTEVVTDKILAKGHSRETLTAQCYDDNASSFDPADLVDGYQTADTRGEIERYRVVQQLQAGSNGSGV